MPTPRYTFFIAHAGNDADTRRARELHALLHPGIPTFLDVVDLMPGDDWSLLLPQAQQASRATIVLISKGSDAAPYLRDEIAAAIRYERASPGAHRLIPVYFDGASENPQDVPYGLHVKAPLDAQHLGLQGVAAQLRDLANTLAAAPAASIDASAVVWGTTRLTPDLKYTLYNFQREVWLARVDELPASEHDTATVILSGTPGIGRGYFLEAARFRARQRGVTTELLTLDLDGFEPDSRSTLAAFASHQMRLRGLTDSPVHQRLQVRVEETFGTRHATWADACLLSLLLDVEHPEREFEALHGGPKREPRAVLAAFLEARAERAHLIVHVTDGAQLSDPLRRWLVGQAEGRHGFVLAISCDPRDATAAVAPAARREPLRFEFTPLDVSELNTWLATHALPDDLVSDLAVPLHRATEGWPARLRDELHALLVDGCVLSTDEGLLRVSNPDAAEAALAHALADKLRAPLDSLCAEQGPRERALREFLHVASLCGPAIPARLLLQAQGLDDEEIESLLECIDERLVERLGVFEDMQFLHPGFPEHGTYRFTNRLVAAAWRDQLNDWEREDRAGTLLRFLEKHAPMASRGFARLQLALCDYLDDDERAPHLGRLAWWIEQEEAEDLTRHLVHALEAGTVDPQALWRAVERDRDRWPRYRLLAVLNAYARQRDGVPWANVGRFCFLRSLCLYTLHQYGDGLADALMALDRCAADLGERSAVYAAVLNTVGLHQFGLGHYVEARQTFERCLSLEDDLHGPDHPSRFAVESNLAAVLAALGMYARARELDERVLDRHMRNLGADHPLTVKAQGRLAATLVATGEYSRARLLDEHVVDWHGRLNDPGHPDALAARCQLARILCMMGEYSRAYSMLEQVVDGFTRTLGPEHPHTLLAQTDFARALSKLGEHERARRLQERVVALWTSACGPDDRQTLIAQANLARTLDALGALADASQLYELTTVAMTRALGPGHPATLSVQANFARNLNALRESSRARRILEQVLDGCTRVLGHNHPDTVAPMWWLTSALAATGDAERAAELRKEVAQRLGRRSSGDLTARERAIRDEIAKQHST